MADAIETKDVDYIKDSLSDVARSKGMLEITRISGVTGEQLLTAIASQEFSSMDSVIALMKSIGLRLEST